MKAFDIKATRNLPDHDKVLQALLRFFYETPGVIGCFLSGSLATGETDEDSDLDVGVLCQSAQDRDSVWQQRWGREIAPWFHRFDADHVKPYFVIYMYQPQIRADINLYVENDLPSYEGGPYTIVWDQKNTLEAWIIAHAQQQPSGPNWQGVVHEDERFWAWSFYIYQHVHRGEYYHVAYEFPALRDIVETWAARLAGHAGFDSRYLENKAFANRLLDADLSPQPNRASLKAAMMDAIEIQLSLREEIGEKLGINWHTKKAAIEKISRLIAGL
jgi:hypothetical protein